MAKNERLLSGVYPLDVPLPPDDEAGWKPYYLFHGHTRDQVDFSCHVSVLSPGHCPHPPHRHREEEILMILSGEAELTLPERASEPEGDRMRLLPGQLVYYPAEYPHTLTPVGDEPVNYLMFKWYQERKPGRSPLPFTRLDAQDRLRTMPVNDGFNADVLLEGKTQWLEKLHIHVSAVTTGGGYEPHVDEEYGVGMILLSGEIDTLGRRVVPHGVVYCAAGEPHGLRNPGSEPARYVVFEFHSRPGLSLWRKALDPNRWIWKVRNLFARIFRTRR